MKKLTFLLIILLVTVILVGCEESMDIQPVNIQGQILDSSNNEPLTKAKVSFVDQEVKTNSDGLYNINKVYSNIKQVKIEQYKNQVANDSFGFFYQLKKDIYIDNKETILDFKISPNYLISNIKFSSSDNLKITGDIKNNTNKLMENYLIEVELFDNNKSVKTVSTQLNTIEPTEFKNWQIMDDYQGDWNDYEVNLRKKIELSLGKINKIPGDNFNFYWPYLLYIPSKLEYSDSQTNLLVIPNNSGFVNNYSSVDEEYALRLINNRKWMADNLNTPLLIPIFPLDEDIYNKTNAWIQTLSYDYFKNAMKYKGLHRIDIQLINMIDHARKQLGYLGIDTDSDILMQGYSASGGFVNRFALLHPERIKAAAMGSPHGWPVVPVKEWNGQKMYYEAGIYGLSTLIKRDINIEEYLSIPLFFYLGDKDIKGDPVPATFNDRAQKIIVNNFGKNRVERWPHAENIYESLKANSTFKLYEGVEHRITQNMWDDVINFLDR